MEIKHGIGVSPGIAIAEAFILDAQEIRIPSRFFPAERVKQELERFNHAVEATHEDLREQRDRVPEDIRGIFDFHLAILGDEVRLLRPTRDLIARRNFTPEHAVSRVFQPVLRGFEEIGDRYFHHRVADVRDVQRRLLRNLVGDKAQGLGSLGRSVCVVASDLTPGETALLDRSHVAGFATDRGGATSHTAILAKALGIPAVVGLGYISSHITSGDLIVIDGAAGKVIVRPDDRTLARYRDLARSLHRDVERLEVSMRDAQPITADGTRISLMANIEFSDEIDLAARHGAEGIGLYRTEFIFMNAKGAPSEQQHLAAYQRSLSVMGDAPVTFRTLDYGADKFPAHAVLPEESNPFLGCRSIRLALRDLETFKRQLRAMLKAALRGNVSIMFPMVSSVEEVRTARYVLRQVMEDLEREGVEFNAQVPVGIMIEIPGAALIADRLAQEVDFFSIGTNDLVQYTLAVDRGNQDVAEYYRPNHQGVWRLIRMVVEAGEKHDVPVSICGEIAGNPLYTMLLLGLGLRRFSVTPHVLPEIKRLVRAVSISECEDMARRAQEKFTADEALDVLSEAMDAHLGDAPDENRT